MTSHRHVIDTVRSRRYSPTVSVVVATLDDEARLPDLLAGLPRHLHEVIVVDGGSRDSTVRLARRFRPDVIVLGQSRTGKGNALAAGFAASTADVVVVLQADGTTDPAEIPRFVATLSAGADLVTGSRLREGGGGADFTPLARRGNRALHALVNVMFGTEFTDLGFGYVAFWRRLLPALDLPSSAQAPATGGREVWGDGFELDTLISVRFAANGLRVREVPSVARPRRDDTGNVTALRAGARVLRAAVGEYRRRVGSRSAGTSKRRPPSAVDTKQGRQAIVSFRLAPATRYDAAATDGRTAGRAGPGRAGNPPGPGGLPGRPSPHRHGLPPNGTRRSW